MNTRIAFALVATTLFCVAQAHADDPPQFVGEISAPGMMSAPYGIVITPSGDLLVADAGTRQVLKCSPGGSCSVWFSSASGAGTLRPTHLAVAADGTVYLADDGFERRVLKISASGSYLGRVGEYVWDPGFFISPGAVVGLRNGNVGIFDTANWGGIEVFAPDGELLYLIGPSNPVEGGYPAGTWTYVPASITPYAGLGVVESPSGGYLVSTYLGTVEEYGADGTDNGSVVTGLSNPSTFLAIDNSGSIYVTMVDHVQKFTAGQLQYTFGTTGSGDGQFHNPQGIAVDSNGNIYVADRGNHRIQIFGNGAPVAVESTSWGDLKAAYR